MRVRRSAITEQVARARVTDADDEGDVMTGGDDDSGDDLARRRPSLLPFEPADLVRIRVLPAELARAFKVSKQTVSQWEKKGWISRGPDGRIDPFVAARRVLLKADPARMRARIFREAMQTQQQLHRRIADLEAQLGSVAECTRNAYQDRQAEQLAALEDEIAAGFDRLVSARAAGRFDDELDAMVAGIFYPESAGPPG